MIDERHEELASLYALDLLEGAERARFETELARDPALQALVRDLRQASASLAHTAPVAPPPAALRQRILDSVGVPATASAPVARREGKVIRSAHFGLWPFAPWAAAAALALAAGWFGHRALALRFEAENLRDRAALSAVELKRERQQLEAERIVAQGLLRISDGKLAEADARLAELGRQLTDRDRLLAEARNALTDREGLLAAARTQLADREHQVATLTQRIDALAGASADIGRQLGEAKQQVAALTQELKAQGDLADLKITALASMAKNSPLAHAIAVWDPKKQEGLLDLQNLPALAANEDYQVWIVDPQYPNPVDGGVFHVEAASASLRFPFKAKQPVSAVNAFAVTRERKGGVPKAEGPFVLLGK